MKKRFSIYSGASLVNVLLVVLKDLRRLVLGSLGLFLVPAFLVFFANRAYCGAISFEILSSSVSLKAEGAGQNCPPNCLFLVDNPTDKIILDLSSGGSAMQWKVTNNSGPSIRVKDTYIAAVDGVDTFICAFPSKDCHPNPTTTIDDGKSKTFDLNAGLSFLFSFGVGSHSLDFSMDAGQVIDAGLVIGDKFVPAITSPGPLILVSTSCRNLER